MDILFLAVKFGRMSKKQRDQLYLEVIKHQQQQPVELNQNEYMIHPYMNHPAMQHQQQQQQQQLPSPEFIQSYNGQQPMAIPRQFPTHDAVPNMPMNEIKVEANYSQSYSPIINPDAAMNGKHIILYIEFYV